MESSEVALAGYVRGLGRLVRLPNVLIIVLTQVLLRYCVLKPLLFANSVEAMSGLPDFLILVIATTFIAMGGYVINDYFDVKIDQVNRPERMVVNRVISRHTAIMTHMILNFIAILLGFLLAWRVKSVSFGLIFPFISGLLWIYSAKYKRVLFWGNFIVSGLSGFVILVLWLFEFLHLRLSPVDFASVLPGIREVNFIFLGYATFAFLVTMVREIVKDLEDAAGDESAGCRTLPIVAGKDTARFIAGCIMVVNVLLLGFAQFVLFRLNLIFLSWYFLLTVQAGALFFLFRLFRARQKKDYHFLSGLCKGIMLAGILSMGFILISN